jgi:hypothetical protein
MYDSGVDVNQRTVIGVPEWKRRYVIGDDGFATWYIAHERDPLVSKIRKTAQYRVAPVCPGILPRRRNM